MDRPAFVSLSSKLSLEGLLVVWNKKFPALFGAVSSLVDYWNGMATGKAVTTAYTAVVADGFIRADATAGAITITLPAAALVPGKRYTIKKVDASANAVTIDANGAELIDGALTKVLAAAYSVATIQSNGVGWDVL